MILRRRSSRYEPRAFALFVAVLCLIVLTLIAGALFSMTSRERLIVRGEILRIQCAWLAEAGVERAADRLGRDPNYAGETWRIPAESLDGLDAGLVTITVETDQENQNRRVVRIQASFPADSTRLNRCSKSLTIDLSRLGSREE